MFKPCNECNEEKHESCSIEMFASAIASAPAARYLLGTQERLSFLRGAGNLAAKFKQLQMPTKKEAMANCQILKEFQPIRQIQRGRDHGTWVYGNHPTANFEYRVRSTLLNKRRQTDGAWVLKEFSDNCNDELSKVFLSKIRGTRRAMSDAFKRIEQMPKVEEWNYFENNTRNEVPPLATYGGLLWPEQMYITEVTGLEADCSTPAKQQGWCVVEISKHEPQAETLEVMLEKFGKNPSFHKMQIKDAQRFYGMICCNIFKCLVNLAELIQTDFHNRNMVHGNLSASNILVYPMGVPILIDNRLVRHMSALPYDKDPGCIVTGYMGPEWFRGDWPEYWLEHDIPVDASKPLGAMKTVAKNVAMVVQVNKSADVYAFGILLLGFVCGYLLQMPVLPNGKFRVKHDSKYIITPDEAATGTRDDYFKAFNKMLGLAPSHRFWLVKKTAAIRRGLLEVIAGCCQ